MELLDHLVILVLDFKNLHMFFIVAASICYPTKGLEGPLFSASSPTFVIYKHSDTSDSDRCEGIFHCSSDLHFSDD